MGNLTLYYVNIAMETTILVVLLILFFSLMLQKKQFATTLPFTFLTGFIILNLVVQIITWTFLIQDVPSIYGAMPMRIVYVLDYVFSYGASVAFYYYVDALASEGYARTGTVYKPWTFVKRVIVAWGVVFAFLYIGMLFMPSIYHLESGMPSFSIPAYICMHIMTKLACVCAFVALFKHRKVIGKHGTALGSVFLILIAGFFIVDELIGVCIGHVILSVFTLVLYVRIDMYKGLLLERSEREITEWKTQIMLSQMQPHFLYNVLTTISSMCEIQNAMQARDVVNRFADYFRANIDSLGKEKTISFEKELEHIKTYLWLEKVRFEDVLHVRYEIGPTQFWVPSLSVQPMVENAVKHGILPKEGGGTVTIRTSETDRFYVIEVEDDGVGFNHNDEERDNRTKIGIENVSRRLKIICNGSFKIRSSKGEGTVVTICIPKGESL